MNQLPSILGVITTHNDWPLLGLSVTHALRNHVDRVAVLDHGSKDGTSDGLAQLQRIWPGRLLVLRIRESDCLPRAELAVLLQACSAREYAWVHVSTASEFLLAPPGSSLPRVLARIDPGIDRITYAVENWLVRQGVLDEGIPGDGTGLLRARPCTFTGADSAILADEIVTGNMNLFDVPHAAGTVVRGESLDLLFSGGNSPFDSASEPQPPPPSGELRAACLHLSESLLARTADDQSFRGAEGSFHHAWRRQVIDQVGTRGEFASIGPENPLRGLGEDGADKGADAPADPVLVTGLQRASDELRSALGEPRRAEETARQEPTELPVSAATWLTTLSAALSRADRLSDRLSSVTAQRDAALAQLDASTAGRTRGFAAPFALAAQAWRNLRHSSSS